jgi:hypothetical protein
MKKILLTSIITLALSHLGFAYGQGKPRFQDPTATFDLRNEFFSLNSHLGFLTTTKHLEVEQQQEVKNLQDRYEKLKSQYQSPATEKIWNLAQDKIAEGQKNAVDTDQQLKIRANAQYSDGYAFIHAYQCTYSKRGVSDSEYVSQLNEALSGMRKSLFILEKRLPEGKDSGALMMSNEQWKKVYGPKILCKKFENGKVIDQQPVAVIEKVEKTRIPPFSASGNPQHEMMCRNLSDPRIPPPPPIKCVFNYK